MQTADIHKISFLRPIYKTLFLKKAAYASFNKQQLGALLRKTLPAEEIFDPMAGYGTITNACAALGVNTYCIEINPPSYLWQMLNSNSIREELLCAVSHARKTTQKEIKRTKPIGVTDGWFPDESKHILSTIWNFTLDSLQNNNQSENNEIALCSILLPLLGRLASHTAGTINIHVKPGGMVNYNNIRQDIDFYLGSLESYIRSQQQFKTRHITICDDASTHKAHKTFSKMITSPPYPTTRDYYAFFFPENYAIENIFKPKTIPISQVRNSLIGTASISKIKKENPKPAFSTLTSETAQHFLMELAEWKGKKRSVDDNRTYYIPYFYNYFKMLQQAYCNISSYMDRQSTGYIVVVNNTARRFIIPVSSFIIETWRAFGFDAEIDSEFTSEKSHVGSINPRAVGFKARHMEYAIRILRG